MSVPSLERPDLPEFMTWEELERLPEEIAGQIELWEGRVVWARRGPAEHQRAMRRITHALEQNERKAKGTASHPGLEIDLETNVFLGRSGKSDFLTPDFLVYRCLESPYQDVRSADTLLAGEVLSPSNGPRDVEAKKARYAAAGIPWYWEVSLAHGMRAIATVRAYGLETHAGALPAGVRPLHPANYLLADEWTPAGSDGIHFNHPFPIHIPWPDLAF